MTDTMGLFRRSYLESGALNADERERQAELEFQEAMSPIDGFLTQAVPEAGSPEEAKRLLAERQGAYFPDPDAGASLPGDRYDRDARVYYRLLRRDYESNPRPRRPRPGTSPFLHDAHALLPGPKGW